MPPAASRVVVLATGDLALPTLEAVQQDGKLEIVRVVTRSRRSEEDEVLPEERQGSRVVEWAEENGVEVRRLRRPAEPTQIESIAALQADVGLMVAFGSRFPEPLLEVPKRGWVKAHFSLLPKFRGLHPIRAALWEGEREVGVSAIQVTEEADAGPILAQEAIEVGSDEVFGDLAPRLADLAPRVGVAGLKAVLRAKKPKAKKQNDKSASRCPRFGERHLSAPWWLEAKDVYDRLRAFSPAPNLVTLAKRKRMRIVRGGPMEWVDAPYGEAGTFIGVRSGRLAILCGGGTVFGIQSVLLEDGRQLSASEVAHELGLDAGYAFY